MLGEGAGFSNEGQGFGVQEVSEYPVGGIQEDINANARVFSPLVSL